MTDNATLQGIVDRLHRLEDERRQAADAIKEIYLEAKSAGFDAKAVRQVVKDMRRTHEAEQAALETALHVDIYKRQLGLFGDDAAPEFRPSKTMPLHAV